MNLPSPTGRGRERVLSCVSGLPVFLAVGLVLTGGDVETLLFLLFLSIICTFGLLGVVYVGLCYVFGRLVLKLVRSFNSSEADGAEPRPTAHSAAPLNPDAQRKIALAEYVRDTTQAGYPLSSVRQQMSHAGWSDIDVDQAFLHASRL